jgi:hypothetical protein
MKYQQSFGAAMVSLATSARMTSKTSQPDLFELSTKTGQNQNKTRPRTRAADMSVAVQMAVMMVVSLIGSARNWPVIMWALVRQRVMLMTAKGLLRLCTYIKVFDKDSSTVETRTPSRCSLTQVR